MKKLKKLTGVRDQTGADRPARGRPAFSPCGSSPEEGLYPLTEWRFRESLWGEGLEEALQRDDPFLEVGFVGLELSDACLQDPVLFSEHCYDLIFRGLSGHLS